MERKTPRIKTNYALDLIPDNTKTSLTPQTIDISEGGLSFEVYELIQGSKPILTKLKLQSYEIETYIEPVWNKYFEEKDRYLYGVKFSSLTEEQKTNLRKTLWSHTEYILENTKKIMELIDQRAELFKKQIAEFFIQETGTLIQDYIQLESNGNHLSLVRIPAKLDELVEKGKIIETKINDKIIAKEIKRTFRDMLGGWIYQSQIMKHALEKPYGYPGDYKLLEIIYDNQELAQGIAKHFDRYFLDNAYAIAVRNRKDLMREILKNFIQERITQREIKTLNIACGGARELRDLFIENIHYQGRLEITCLDFDQEALTYAEKTLQPFTNQAAFHFVKEDVIKLVNHPEKKNLYQDQDLVYSIGLADYLPDRILKKLIHFSWEITKPGGELIIAFKDEEKDKHGPLPPDWYCNWTFVPRTKAKVMDLIESCNLNSSSQIVWEPSGIIFYVILTKP